MNRQNVVVCPALQYGTHTMLERNRVPKVVVYYPGRGQEPDDPIHEYVMEHYEVVQEIGKAKVMVPKGVNS